MRRPPRPDEGHKCPYPSCNTSVPHAMFACSPHWYLLPDDKRAAIWRGYRKQPLGPEHLAAMRAARQFYAQHPAEVTE